MNAAERLRQYIGKASFSAESDRFSAMECINVISRERYTLQSKLDNGIRMHVRQSPHSGIWADTVNCTDRQNCTVALDDGVEL